MNYQEIRKKVDEDLYKNLSDSQQRDEASRKVTAIWHNMKLEEVLDFDNKNISWVIARAQSELERSILDLIIQRDK